MIDIYTEKKESKDWIIQNDLYFNLNTSNEEMSKEEIELIREESGSIRPTKVFPVRSPYVSSSFCRRNSLRRMV